MDLWTWWYSRRPTPGIGDLLRFRLPRVASKSIMSGIPMRSLRPRPGTRTLLAKPRRMVCLDSSVAYCLTCNLELSSMLRIGPRGGTMCIVFFTQTSFESRSSAIRRAVWAGPGMCSLVPFLCKVLIPMRRLSRLLSHLLQTRRILSRLRVTIAAAGCTFAGLWMMLLTISGHLILRFVPKTPFTIVFPIFRSFSLAGRIHWVPGISRVMTSMVVPLYLRFWVTGA